MGMSLRQRVTTIVVALSLAVTGIGILEPAIGAPSRDGAPATHTAALPVPAPRPSVVDLRFGRHPDKTRIVIELSESAAYKVATAGNPARLMVEFGNLAPGSGALAEGPGVGIIERYHQEASGAGRMIVFTAAESLRVREAFTIPPRDGRRFRLVVDIEPGTTDKPADAINAADNGSRNVPVTQVAFLQPPSAPASNHTLLVPPPMPEVKPAPESKPAPEVRAAPEPKPEAQRVSLPIPAVKPQQPAAQPEQLPLVVIDPGHGGPDPGALGVNGIYEKDITLATARELRRQLLASGHYRVKMTRDSDVFIRLRDRVAVAREANADLFVSLHADTIAHANISGLSIYTLSTKASDREAEMLAAKENRADALAGMNLAGENDLVASILIDLAQRDTMNHSKRFAALALRQFARDVRVLSAKPQREAGFAVLTAPDVPSALVEMGYLSNPQDVKLLASDSHREKLARDLVGAVDAYFGWLRTAKR